MAENMNTPIRTELRAELIPQIRTELRAELRAELIPQIRTELRAELMAEIRALRYEAFLKERQTLQFAIKPCRNAEFLFVPPQAGM